jgi:hypothetical protein
MNLDQTLSVSQMITTLELSNLKNNIMWYEILPKPNQTTLTSSDFISKFILIASMMELRYKNLLDKN